MSTKPFEWRLEWRQLLLLSTLILPTTVLARTPAASLSPAVYQALQQAQQALKEKRPKQAEKDLKRAQSKARKAYDRALIEQNRAYIAMAAGDWPTVTRAITAALANKALPAGAAGDLRYLQAQLLVRDDRTPEAISRLEALLHNHPKRPDAARRLLARLYLRNNQTQEAATLLEQILQHAPKPNDKLYDLLAAADYRLGRYRHSIPLLKTLIRRQPANSGYWTRLIAGQLAAGLTQEALATLELAHGQGYLDDPQDSVRLAQLYRHQGLPLQAAELLQQAIVQGRLVATTSSLRELADAWQQAREWRKAGTVLEQALTSCNESDKGPLHLRLGITHYRAQDWQGAYRELSRAADYPQTGADARQWLARLSHQHPTTSPAPGETS